LCDAEDDCLFRRHSRLSTHEANQISADICEAVEAIGRMTALLQRTIKPLLGSLEGQRRPARADRSTAREDLPA